MKTEIIISGLCILVHYFFMYRAYNAPINSKAERVYFICACVPFIVFFIFAIKSLNF